MQSIRFIIFILLCVYVYVVCSYIIHIGYVFLSLSLFCALELSFSLSHSLFHPALCFQ